MNEDSNHHYHHHHEHGDDCDHDHPPINYANYINKQQLHGHGHQHSNCCSHDHHSPEVPIEYEYISKEIKRDYIIEKEFFIDNIKYMQYKDETQMPHIMNLITKDLSEPYSIYTYRYL